VLLLAYSLLEADFGEVEQSFGLLAIETIGFFPFLLLLQFRRNRFQVPMLSGDFGEQSAQSKRSVLVIGGRFLVIMVLLDFRSAMIERNLATVAGNGEFLHIIRPRKRNTQHKTK